MIQLLNCLTMYFICAKYSDIFEWGGGDCAAGHCVVLDYQSESGLLQP